MEKNQVLDSSRDGRAIKRLEADAWNSFQVYFFKELQGITLVLMQETSGSLEEKDRGVSFCGSWCTGIGSR